MRKTLTLLLLGVASATAMAQVSISASSVTDSFTHTLQLARLCFMPVDATMTPQGFRVGSVQVMPQETCGVVTSGALQSGLSVQPNPTGLNYHVYVKASNSNNIIRDFGMVHITGSSWSLDNYDPNMAVVPVGTLQVGTVTTVAPGTGASCAITGSGPYLLNCSVPQGVNGSSGNGTPGGTDMSTLSGDFGAKLNSCASTDVGVYGGICEGRAVSPSQSMASTLTINTPNVVINLPCGTITTAQTVTVPAGVRNVSFHGCGYQGGSNSSVTQGGSVWVYTGNGPAFEIGDPTYAQDTRGFHMDNVNINTASGGSGASAFYFYRTQEIDLRGLYLNGASGQTGVTLDGTGDYTGGTFDSDTVSQYTTAYLLTGHLSGSAVGDFANASTFTRQHINCPESGGNPITGTFGFNVVAGDGNTWTGGDVEGCDTMFHLGANAVNNTVVGLRNENSNMQYVADSGSSFNSVVTGGTFFTGKLTDNGSRNHFQDAFHYAVNGMKGDWYASQQDATVTNHLRLGTGTGNLRGLQWESAVDQGTSANINNWEWGMYDGAGGWFYQDLINNVPRLLMGVNGITPGGNSQSALNAAGTGNVCFNCSANSGTGGVAFSSGGASPTTVGTLDSTGNFVHYGYHTFMDPATSAGAWRFNCAVTASCNIDALGGGSPVHHLRMYQGAGTDIDSEGTSPVTINNSTGSGTGGLYVYNGGSTKWFVVSGLSAVGMPGLAASSGHNCLQVDNSGWLTNTGSACGTGNGNGNGSVTSVSLTVPADESVSGSPVTVSGGFAISRNNQAPNLFLAGPCSGSSTTPGYRALCANDLAGFGFATLASPTFTGTPVVPGYETTTAAALLAPLASPTFTGTPTVPGYTPTSTTVNGHALSSNVTVSASDLITGTLPHAQLPALVSGDIPANAANTSGNAGTATKLAANTLGCLDGWDHLPCTVYEMGTTSESAVTGSYATAYTTPAAGVYRITGNVYATTAGSTAYTVTVLVKEAQTGSVTSHGMGVASAAVGTSEGWNNGTLVTQNLSSGVAIQWETSGSGTNTGSVWSIDLVIERVK